MDVLTNDMSTLKEETVDQVDLLTRTKVAQ